MLKGRRSGKNFKIEALETSVICQPQVPTPPTEILCTLENMKNVVADGYFEGNPQTLLLGPCFRSSDSPGRKAASSRDSLRVDCTGTNSIVCRSSTVLTNYSFEGLCIRFKRGRWGHHNKEILGLRVSWYIRV